MLVSPILFMSLHICGSFLHFDCDFVVFLFRTLAIVLAYRQVLWGLAWF